MFFLSNIWACFSRKNRLLLVLFSTLLLAGCGNSTAFPLTQFAIPTARSGPDVITVGPDKALWFVKSHAIGRITVQGKVTEFPVATEDDMALIDITAGPDGALWFTVFMSDQVGRIPSEAPSPCLIRR